MVLQKVLAVSPADMQGPRPRVGGTARPLSSVSAYPVKLCSSSSSLSRWENTAWSNGSWECDPSCHPYKAGVMQEVGIGAPGAPQVWITSCSSHFRETVIKLPPKIWSTRAAANPDS